MNITTEVDRYAITKSKEKGFLASLFHGCVFVCISVFVKNTYIVWTKLKVFDLLQKVLQPISDMKRTLISLIYFNEQIFSYHLTVYSSLKQCITLFLDYCQQDRGFCSKIF